MGNSLKYNIIIYYINVNSKVLVVKYYSYNYIVHKIIYVQNNLKEDLHMAQAAASTAEGTKKYIRLESPLPFDSAMETSVTTTFKLSRKINTLFHHAFNDYEGCMIVPSHTGQLELRLYFKAKDGSDVVPIVAASAPGQRAPINERLKNFNRINKNRTVKLSDETKELLESMMLTYGKNKIDWERQSLEEVETTHAGYNIYMHVFGLDLNKILKVLYGSKNPKTDARLEYMIQVIRPVGDPSIISNNYLISIIKLDSAAVEEVSREVGIIPSIGNIQMVRVTV